MSDLQHTNGRIFVLRHGETEWSATGQHTSFTDLPLTERGRRLALASGQILATIRGTYADPFVLALSSPRKRALDTAKLAGLSPEIDDTLVEWNYGDYEGLTTPQIRETVPDWSVWTHGNKNGESIEQVGERADTVLHRCREALSGGDVVLTGHGHFSRVLTARWLNLPVSAGVGFKLNAGGLIVFGHDRDSPSIDHANLIDPRI
jgi:probable phosphoglycerate mutase